MELAKLRVGLLKNGKISQKFYGKLDQFPEYHL